MKKNIFRVSLYLVLASFIVVSCDNWSKLSKDYYVVSPNPLELKGGKVAINVKGQFPPKTFKSTYALEIEPELVYASGITKLEAVIFQGEKFPGNYPVVPYEQGKTITFAEVIDYNPNMLESALWVKLVGLKPGNQKEKNRTLLGSVKIADGVITTPLLVQDNYKVALAVSEFARDVKKDTSARINFLVNSSVVRPAQLKNKDYVNMMNLIKEASMADSKLSVDGFDFVGYASPEGEATLNENLSIDRAKAVEKIVQNFVKKSKIQIADPTLFYTEKGEGADWNGFYALLEASNLADKATIKRTLDAQPLLANKERTLKGLEDTYPIIRNTLLPELRRCEIKAKYTVKGRTDEEILTIALSDNPSVLSQQEFMHAATLTEDNAQKIQIYKGMQLVYPQDYRGYNNEGVILAIQGKKDLASALFEKAFEIEKNPITYNNMGVVFAQNGEQAKAMEYFANSSVVEASYNKGVIQIKLGEYAEAVNNFSGENDFNAALAKLLNGDYQGAINTLNAADDKTPIANYLRAIAFARQGKLNDAKNLLAELANTDAQLAAKAQKDLEFRLVFNPPVTKK